MRLKIVALLIGVISLISPQAQAIDSSELKSRCANITPQQKQMAKMAGYNLDEMCSQLGSFENSQNNTNVIQNVVPRGTQLDTSARGVIGEPADVTKHFQQDMDIAKTGLQKFGYDLFAGVPTTFAPATDIPIPLNYVMGPGDQLKIQLLGKVGNSFELAVGRDGTINFPELGPISLAGLSFSEAKARILEIVSEQMIGVRAVVSLGELRSIRIFVLGEAFKPGSYTVSALSTMTNALFVSGGVKEYGSLRNIQLKRQGKVITHLDLYDLLLKGDTSGDARLQPGDVIYIPPVGKTAGIDGEVKRPAIYELKGKQNLDALIKLAGGYSANAYPSVSNIVRKSASGFTKLLDLDLKQSSSLKSRLFNGDRVTISSVLEEFEDVVELKGTFHRPRKVRWHGALKLSHLIKSVKDFRANTDLNIALVIRKSLPLRDISVLHFSPRDIIAGRLADDLILHPMDEIITFSATERVHESAMQTELDKTKRQQKEESAAGTMEFAKIQQEQREKEELSSLKNSRADSLLPVIDKLKEQTANGQLIRIVEISGNVRLPGTYPLTRSMNVRDLILLAGGLKEASYFGNSEITRRDLSDRETATIEHITVNLAEQLTGSKSFELQAKDKLAIYVTPEYREQLSINLQGEVRFPGEYEFSRGETLSQVIGRAGGFTTMAHTEAAIFTRLELKQQEAKRLQELHSRMRADLAASSLEEVAAGESNGISNADSLLQALANTEAVGRLVIDLIAITNGQMDDIQLKNGDNLIIPTFRQEVSVLGEVQHTTSHLFNQHWTLDDYLEKSGGMTNRADDDRIYVVKADGSVFLPNQSGWLSHQNEMLNPGDTIVVPLDSDRIKSLTLWSNVSQIIYQLALGAAAVNSL